MNASTLLTLSLTLIAVTWTLPAVGQAASLPLPVAATRTPQNPPAATPQPQTTVTTPRMAVHGIACVDLDRDGLCSTNEARIPEVIVRGSDGAVAITDNAGRYTIQTAAAWGLEVTIPLGFKSLNGNLRQLRIHMFTTDQVDIALAVDTPADVTKGTQQPVTADFFKDPARVMVDLINNSNPLYVVLGGLGIILTLSFLLLAVIVSGFRRAYQRSISQQSRALRDEREKELAQQLQSAHGWQQVAEQIVADALREAVSVDGDAGILDVAAEPSPKFTILLRDKREVVFTTSPRLMKKVKLIRRGDRVVDVTARSLSNHIDAGILWYYMLATRNLARVTPPSSAHWYVVVRQAGAKVVSTRSLPDGKIKALPVTIRRLLAPPGGRG